MSHNLGPVLELVIFKLNEGVDRAEFLRASDGISSWARKQPGFISRTLSHDPETDTYFDVVYWRSMDDAQAAIPVAERSDECAPAFEMIDRTNVLMHHGVQQAEPVAV